MRRKEASDGLVAFAVTVLIAVVLLQIAWALVQPMVPALVLAGGIYVLVRWHTR